MSFFDIFDNKPYPKLEDPKPMTIDDEPAYQVGVTPAGLITLRVGHSTVTMNSAGVARLIRVLEAAADQPPLMPEYDDEDPDGHPN